MASDLTRFDLTAMLRCGMEMRSAAHQAQTLDNAAESVVRFIHDEFRDAASGERQLALVRFYRTQSYDTLDLAQRRFADRLLDGATPDRRLRCLCLVATAGVERAWNERQRSRGHLAIPLPEPAIVERAPMIAQLLRGFGLDIAAVIHPERMVPAEMQRRTYGVFHVERALGSQYIPAQSEFVEPYGIASVVGFGGALRGGDIFAVILFSTVTMRHDVADRFRSLALDVKAAIFDYASA